MRNKVYILGGAQTDFERNWTKEGKNVIALLKEVIADGFADANFSQDNLIELNKKNKVGVFVGNFIAEKYINQSHLGALLSEVSPAFYGVPSARYEAACASSSVALDTAISKIISKELDVSIVVGWEIMKTVDSKTGGDILGFAAYREKECINFDYPFPRIFSYLAEETIKKYNIDRDCYLNSLSKISLKNYSNAKNNPLAQTRKWYKSYEEICQRGSESNPFIGGFLAVSDCSQITDGACVVILCSESYAKKNKIIGKPIVKGVGHRNAPFLMEKKMKENVNSEFILPWTRQTCLDAYKRAHLDVDDIDFFETHDCFTCTEFITISSFGLCSPGNECQIIESGLINLNGQKPINPSGGLIGCGHPVGASGVRMFLDLYKQVTRKAKGYQVIGAKNGMMLNLGGSATTNYSFIIGME